MVNILKRKFKFKCICSKDINTTKRLKGILNCYDIKCSKCDREYVVYYG